MTQINTRELLLQPYQHRYFDSNSLESPTNQPHKPCRACPTRYRGQRTNQKSDVDQPIIDTIQLLRQPYQPSDECNQGNIIDTVAYLKYPHELKNYSNSCQNANCQQCQQSNLDECGCSKRKDPKFRSTNMLRAANLINDNLYACRPKSF